ncbi:sulfite exporter TauE/SafE family protein [Sungkyunkwania multivorans]|uniref:Probable membrane transporter protein n=1 Tax=Sungkyunkwania multivorans TaxID=1173618 RepID=A0ABW3CVE6_9FLAO
MEFSWEYILLIAVGTAAGFINTLAGGGSLLTLPTLIFMGLPPAVANGTNRIAILIQTFFAIRGFKSKGVSTFPFSLYVAVSALFGSILGAKLAIDIKGETFNKILAVIMVLVVLMIVLKPKASLGDLEERITGKYRWISVFLFFFVGIYGGFIQAGVGFFMLLILPLVNRLSLVKSNATKVFVAFIYTIAAVVVFALEDKINYKLGLTLAVGNATGAWFGSRWSVDKGDKAIKIFLVVMVMALAAKLWFF